MKIKWFQNWFFQKKSIKKSAPIIIFFNENFFQNDFDNFWHRKLSLKFKILPFLKTFTQLTTRLKHFLMDWVLVLGLIEGLVECAPFCLKSEVILVYTMHYIYCCHSISSVYGVLMHLQLCPHHKAIFPYFHSNTIQFSPQMITNSLT